MIVSGSAAVIALIGLALVATIFVVFLPKFLASAWVANHMSAVRDDLIDAILVGELSEKDPAVHHLRHRVEYAVSNHSRLSMASLLSFSLRTRNRPDVLEALSRHTPKSENPEVNEAVKEYDERMAGLAVLHAILSTWFGIGVTVLFVAWIALRHTFRTPLRTARRYGQSRALQYLAVHDEDIRPATVA